MVVVFFRGMGLDVMFVLINGCCVVISVFVESIINLFVDINFIFVFVIEWIDILKDGVFVIYGLDVVVGVVNVVLKKDYEGLEINVGYGGIIGLSYDEIIVSILWGF